MARRSSHDSYNRSSSDDEVGVRVDKWLWAARFFKTRALAAEAVNGGHVHVNGARVKPARGVREGDELSVTKGPYTFRLTVTGVSARRGPAEQARTMYEEHPDSVAARQALAEQRRLAAAAVPAPRHRPDKRERRRIIRFTRKEH